ncbi:hypothetical protein [Hwangdonia lutea]|uniref:Uncharacterized protein n=1 Tax=Hwangdonia lutea TaxID=3075823 RepID=A0AA97HQD9_9FLAO|nr:hypothetical protein [Hwangdonia sp. SCSIO 19198]WOD42825.1 hypothetical protein RNZ46_12580 [Hwangdonia sp. SCSIO 19198]
MRNNINLFIKSLSLILFVATQLVVPLQAQNTKTNVYVWDFKTNDQTIEKYAEKFTDDFETELIRLDKYTVLQRRNHNLVLTHRNMENTISNVKNLPTETVNKLKTIKAEMVAFGELTEDVDSGIYEVTVFFQNLSNGEIPKKENVIIAKDQIGSNSSRKAYMKSLIKKLHAKEILEAKSEQFSFISKKMDTYMIRVKDVQTAFDDTIDIAIENQEFFKDLDSTIKAYNSIYSDLSDNSEKYILDFESVFGKAYGKDFESVYKGIKEGIHKKHILKLNAIRKKIWDYQKNQNNKKERERIKKEIIRDSKNSTIGLNTAIDNVEDDMDKLFSNIKEDLRAS